MRERLDKIINSKFGNCVEKFFGSVFYILLVGVISIVCHTFDLVMVGTVVWTVLLLLIFVFCKNMFALTPFIAMCTFIMSKDTTVQTGYYNTTYRMVILIIELVLLVSALVFGTTYYKRWKLIFKKGYLTVSLCFVTAVLLLGGLGAETFSVSGILIGFGVAATMFLPYSLIVNCGQYEGSKTVRYFAWITVVAAIVIGAAVIQVYLFSESNFVDYLKYFLQFGYAGPNTGSAFVVISLPLTFYLIYSYRHGYLILPIAFLEVLIVVALFSRASLVVIIPFLLILFIVVGVKRKQFRWAYCVISAIILAVVITISAIKWSVFSEMFLKAFPSIKTDSGRFELWKLGFDNWKKTPVFGLGLQFLLVTELPYPAVTPYYSFHNTPLTYLFCCGIVGIAAYLYHRYKTVRLVFSTKLTAERVFVAIAVLGMILNALLDIGMTYPQLVLYYSVMLAIIECDVRYTKDRLTVPNAVTINTDTEGEKNE